MIHQAIFLWRTWRATVEVIATWVLFSPHAIGLIIGQIATAVSGQPPTVIRSGEHMHVV
jgi:hypothetical protein